MIKLITKNNWLKRSFFRNKPQKFDHVLSQGYQTGLLSLPNQEISSALVLLNFAVYQMKLYKVIKEKLTNNRIIPKINHLSPW